MISDAMIVTYFDRLGRCSRHEQVVNALAQEATRFHLNAIACWMITGPKAASKNPFYANTWPPFWAAFYEEGGYLEKDPFARWAIRSGAPISFSSLLKRLPASDPGHKISRAAHSFGFREGFGIPVRSFSGHLGLFTFFGDRRPLSREEQIFLLAICPATLHRIEALSPMPVAASASKMLSLREHECAALLCEGLSNPAIALRLGITIATVKFHLGNASAKLGARSRAQLASLLPPKSGVRTDYHAAANGEGRGDKGMLLRSDDGRIFEIDKETALRSEVTSTKARSTDVDQTIDADGDDNVVPHWSWTSSEGKFLSVHDARMLVRR